MSNLLKIIIISFLVFIIGVLPVFFVFTDIFYIKQIDYINLNIENKYKKELNDIGKKIENHLSMIETNEINSLMAKFNFEKFLDKQKSRDISLSDELSGAKNSLITSEYGLEKIKIFDNLRKTIFSTDADETEKRGPFLTFKSIDDIDKNEELFTIKNNKLSFIFDNKTGYIIIKKNLLIEKEPAGIILFYYKNTFLNDIIRRSQFIDFQKIYFVNNNIVIIEKPVFVEIEKLINFNLSGNTIREVVYRDSSGNEISKLYRLFYYEVKNANLYIARFIDNDVFKIKKSHQVIIFYFLLFSLYLLLLLLLLLRKSKFDKAKEKMSLFVSAILEEMIEAKTKEELEKIHRHLAIKKENLLKHVFFDFKKLKSDDKKKLETELDMIFNRIDESLKQRETSSQETSSLNKIESMFEKFISTIAEKGINISSSDKIKTVSSTVEKIEDVEEIEEAEDAEDIEEIEEAGEAEALTEVEEIESAEEIDTVEDISEAEELEEGIVEEETPEEVQDEILQTAEIEENLEEIKENEIIEDEIFENTTFTEEKEDLKTDIAEINEDEEIETFLDSDLIDADVESIDEAEENLNEDIDYGDTKNIEEEELNSLKKTEELENLEVSDENKQAEEITEDESFFEKESFEEIDDKNIEEEKISLENITEEENLLNENIEETEPAIDFSVPEELLNFDKFDEIEDALYEKTETENKEIVQKAENTDNKTDEAVLTSEDNIENIFDEKLLEEFPSEKIEEFQNNIKEFYVDINELSGNNESTDDSDIENLDIFEQEVNEENKDILINDEENFDSIPPLTDKIDEKSINSPEYLPDDDISKEHEEIIEEITRGIDELESLEESSGFHEIENIEEKITENEKEEILEELSAEEENFSVPSFEIEKEDDREKIFDITDIVFDDKDKNIQDDLLKHGENIKKSAEIADQLLDSEILNTVIPQDISIENYFDLGNKKISEINNKQSEDFDDEEKINDEVPKVPDEYYNADNIKTDNLAESIKDLLAQKTPLQIILDEIYEKLQPYKLTLLIAIQDNYSFIQTHQIGCEFAKIEKINMDENDALTKHLFTNKRTVFASDISKIKNSFNNEAFIKELSDVRSLLIYPVKIFGKIRSILLLLFKNDETDNLETIVDTIDAKNDDLRKNIIKLI